MRLLCHLPHTSQLADNCQKKLVLKLAPSLPNPILLLIYYYYIMEEVCNLGIKLLSTQVSQITHC